MITINEKIQRVEEKVELYNSTTEKLYSGITYQNEQLSNQISNTNNLIGLMSFILAIATVFLGIWIQKKYNQIKKVNREIAETKKFIQGHTTQLYLKLKEEESNELVGRLINNPKDISHYFSILATRSLNQNLFNKVKSAYINVKTEPLATSNDMNTYIAIMYYHFPQQALEDDILVADFEKFLNINGLGFYYPKEVVKILDSIFLHSNKTSNYKVLLNAIKSLNQISTLKDQASIKNRIEEIFKKIPAKQVNDYLVSEEIRTIHDWLTKNENDSTS